MSEQSWKADAPVVAVAFDRSSRQAAFALGDGTVRLVEAGGEPRIAECHAGAALALVPDAAKTGFVSGGDDGKLIRIAADASQATLATFPGKWIEQIATSEVGGIAFGAGREVMRLDRAGAPQGAPFPHPSTVAGVVFDPKGKRLAVAHYGGVSLWWCKAQEQKPKLLAWRGSHVLVSWSPDGAYVMSATQENDLHGWRLSDANDLRMSGYPTKVKSLAWSARPSYLASSGADQIVCWPFAGAGPSGKAPIEFGGRGGALVTVVAAHPKGDWLAAGYDEGAVGVGQISEKRVRLMLAPTGGRAASLAWSADGRWIAAGDEDGTMRLVAFGEASSSAMLTRP
ncbi:MAG: WD40 repeat domain-containing protein [Proteobacteria bacterium]|nr:WD40 repeat domain-containing protein [Pseudomonadota bacterium]MBI3499343.1 WD40 repeat domain-containing protein [Pseudomonadota bacterium]